MTTSPDNDDRADRISPAAAMVQIEAVCERFEQACRAGQCPRIEDFLVEAPPALLAELFAELLAIEMDYLCRSGQTPSAEAYRTRFPAHGAAIQAKLGGTDATDAADTQDFVPSGAAPKAPGISTRARKADDVFEAALAEYLGRLDRGDKVNREEFLAAHPDAADRLRSYFSDANVVEALLGPALADTQTYASNAVPPDTELPATIGRYRVRGVLGEGSFGKVYLASDSELGRFVAIKSLRGPRFGSTHALEMLRAEARKLARLRHPAIVTAHDVGPAADGGCFVVMEYVAGCSLKERLQSQRLGLRHAAEGMATAAEALHHAHQQGLVHCDVKPGNLLIDREGGFHVADFGLAIQEDERDALQGYVGGTPVYMAPEQTRGEAHRIDGRTDVWALGAVLYEVLTLKRPFSSEDREELFRSIQASEPATPTGIDPSIPAELERICLKCLSKRMADRYRTALDVAKDLRLWLRGAEGGQAGPWADSQADATAGAAAIFSSESSSAVPVVPRGLRSFSPQDHGFFLDLLPGPRDREGLPEIVRFWKSRLQDIEDGDPCSLLYGPSGCGKSSLLKAAILPRLPDHVVPVYIEATPQATEASLLRELRARCPQLPDGATLAQAVAALRGGRIAWPDRKMLIVLDQFEQWLHAHRGDSRSELVRALRQCDGQRLQCLLMVRDDFWLATTRFLQAVEVSLVEGRNVGVVDLFDPPHAETVLTRFGQAYGALPERLAQLTAQQRRFLERAVHALSQDGKVVPVRLSLFAEMIKSRPWLPATLDEVGGVEGLGVAFLEESFGHRAANPQHRRHRAAAEALLKILLPEHGGNLRGHVRSEAELASAAGYPRASAEFADVLRALDNDLRLITPTDPEGQSTAAAEAAADSRACEEAVSLAAAGSPALAEKYYQLSHDFLVPSLRDWLSREEKRTWRGRARLVLEERAAQWRHDQKSRYLPSPLECARILAAVPRRRWKTEQRAMMRSASRRHGLRAFLLLAAALLSGWGAWEFNGHMRGSSVNEKIWSAEASKLVGVLDTELPAYRHWALPQLARVADDEAAPPDERLRASLAVVASDPGQVDFLRQRLLDCPLDIFPAVRDRLAPHADAITDELWAVLRDEGKNPEARFRAGLALAAYQPETSQWSAREGEYLANALVRAGPDWQRDLRQHLRPIATMLLQPLREAFGDEGRADGQRVAAAAALADYAADQPEVLAELASEATPSQYDLLFAALHGKPEGRETARAALRRIVDSADAAATSAAQRVHRGRRKAGAAVTLLRLGFFADAAGIFRAGNDPEHVTQAIHGLKPRGVQAPQLLAWFRQCEGRQARFALLLALGEFPAEALPRADRTQLVARLTQWYASEPDSGVRNACGWLLRRWGHESEVLAVDGKARPPDPAGRREWFIERIGEESCCFVVFPSGEFAMGAPDWDPDRSRDETLHAARVTRPFALCDREVTRRQYEAFLKATRKPRRDVQEIAATPEHAMVGVGWYDAVRYCRWLTEQAGMTEADQCYLGEDHWERDSRGHFGGMGFHPDRPGYRLPTEAEWEYACRGGTITPYSFGSDHTLLDRYAWFFDNAGRQAHLPAELRPNSRGLFDMHGNAAEWCDDLYRAYPTGAPAAGGPYPVLLSRVHRGGGWGSRADESRSAFRGSNQPDARQAITGLRVAKTLFPPR